MWVNVIAPSSAFPDFYSATSPPRGRQKCRFRTGWPRYASKPSRASPPTAPLGGDRCLLHGRQRVGQRMAVAALTVRIAGAEHHHVLFAGEAEPLAGELDVARAVETALAEVHMSR